MAGALGAPAPFHLEGGELENLTVVVPFFNGHRTLPRLLDSLPSGLPVVVVNDHSDDPLHCDRHGTRVVSPPSKGFFSGAVNYGVDVAGTDVLVVNQDAWFSGDAWLTHLAQNRPRYALIGDGVHGHPAWSNGYVQGTFMFVRRDAWEAVGPLNAEMYPLWGATCEWQLRACRKGFEVLPLEGVAGLKHRKRARSVGGAIATALKRWPSRRREFLRTPPEVSVVVPCYNYGQYLDDALNSLLGGSTSLGDMPGQSFQSFEVVVVDDASTDPETREKVRSCADAWRGVRTVRLSENRGTPGALNEGVRNSFGKFIHILSADDMREPWALEKLHGALQGEPDGVAYFGAIQTFKHGVRDRLLPLPRYDFDRLLVKNPMPAGTMYSRDAWKAAGGYPERMKYGREDWAFNIALGAAGHCGLRVNGTTGNLCRREQHNRSVRTQGRGWQKRFRIQLQSLFPQLYEGERPVGCCGGRRRGRRSAGGSAPAAPAAVALPGKGGFELLRYVGGNVGTMTWYGPVTDQVYHFGANNKDRIGYVDKRDAPGMLALREDRKRIFSIQVVAGPEPDLGIDSGEAERVNPGTTEPAPAPVDATPRAVQIAESYGLDLSTVTGTGQEGRITVNDVKKAHRG